ncbi:MAG: hypothetical protein JO019_04225 [Candidatus Kaiserbacteria bacterium]|nr:hypothetical protein [Candidatus Kaiserbacteria bacterium]
MEYAYLTLDLFFAVLWMLIFVFRADVRRELLVTSLILTLFSILEPIIARDYFAPEYALPIFRGFGFEDVMYCFFLGGLASVIHDAFLRNRGTERTARHLFIWAALLAAGFAAFFIGTLAFHANSIMYGAVLLLVLGTLHLIVRPELWANAVSSALLTLAIVFVAYRGWLLPLYPSVMHDFIRSDSYLFNIPVQEYLFALAWGFYCGPAYKFALGLRARRATARFSLRWRSLVLKRPKA